MLSIEPVLRNIAVDREIRFSTEQYGCRQRNDPVWTPVERRIRTNAIDFLKKKDIAFSSLIQPCDSETTRTTVMSKTLIS